MRLKERFPIIGDVRGAGLAFGVELVRPGDSGPRTVRGRVTDQPDAGRRPSGGGEGMHANIVKMRSPLVLTPADADLAVEALGRALARL